MKDYLVYNAIKLLITILCCASITTGTNCASLAGRRALERVGRAKLPETKIAIMRALRTLAVNTTRFDEVRIVTNFHAQLLKCIGSGTLTIPGTSASELMHALEHVHSEILFNLNQGRQLKNLPTTLPEADPELLPEIEDAATIILRALDAPIVFDTARSSRLE